jgi:hypothetical protein
VNAAVLHCGLISGYTAPQAVFVGRETLTKRDLMMDIAADFGFLGFWSY